MRACACDAPVVVGVDELVREQLREQQRPVGRELVGAADGVEHAAGEREAQAQRVGRRLVVCGVALVVARVRQVVRELRVHGGQQALLLVVLVAQAREHQRQQRLVRQPHARRAARARRRARRAARAALAARARARRPARISLVTVSVPYTLATPYTVHRTRTTDGNSFIS